jgi:hypothetical protein
VVSYVRADQLPHLRDITLHLVQLLILLLESLNCEVHTRLQVLQANRLVQMQLTSLECLPRTNHPQPGHIPVPRPSILVKVEVVHALLILLGDSQFPYHSHCVHNFGVFVVIHTTEDRLLVYLRCESLA